MAATRSDRESRALMGSFLCLLLILGCAEKREDSDGPAALGAALGHPANHGFREGTRGVVLHDLVEDGPAVRAGLQPRDLVQAIDGFVVDDPCHLGQAILERRPGQEVKLTLWRATQVFEETVELGNAFDIDGPACEDGRGESCRRLGNLYATGWGDPKVAHVPTADPQRAAELYQRACESGSLAGCVDLGVLLFQQAPYPNLDRARGLFQKACDSRNAAGCTHLAALYATGEWVPKDDARAFALYQEACAGGDAAGCYNVGLHFETGRGRPQNLSRARISYENACDLGSFPGCTSLGSLYERGLGVPADLERAGDLYRRSCAGDLCNPGDPLGCFNLGVLHRDGRGVAPDKAKAAEYFEQSCRGYNASGCGSLADLLYTGDGVARDELRAVVLFHQACDDGHEPSCRKIEALEGSSPKVRRSDQGATDE